LFGEGGIDWNITGIEGKGEKMNLDRRPDNKILLARRGGGKENGLGRSAQDGKGGAGV